MVSFSIWQIVLYFLCLNSIFTIFQTWQFFEINDIFKIQIVELFSLFLDKLRTKEEVKKKDLHIMYFFIQKTIKVKMKNISLWEQEILTNQPLGRSRWSMCKYNPKTRCKR